MDTKSLILEELGNLGKDELLDLVKQLIQIPETVQQGRETVAQEQDEMEVIELYEEGKYTEEEMTGDYRYTDEEIEAVVGSVKPDEEIPSEKQVLDAETIREMSLQEQEKILEEKQKQLKQINQERISRVFKSLKNIKVNTTAGLKALGSPISNKVRKYGIEYASAEKMKESIEEDYTKVQDQLAVAWNSVYNGILEEIEGLENAEKAQQEKVDKIVNAKNEKLSKRQEINQVFEQSLVEAARRNNGKELRKAARMVENFQKSINEYDKRIKEETKKLEEIRADLAKSNNRLDEKMEEHNAQLAKLDLQREEKLEIIPKQNIFKRTIGKIVNKFNKKKEDKKQQEVLDKMKNEVLPKAQQDKEEYEQAREEREQERDGKYWNDIFGIPDKKTTLKERYGAYKQQGLEKVAQRREDDRKRKADEAKEKRAKRIEKLQGKIDKGTEKLYGKNPVKPVVEGR